MNFVVTCKEQTAKDSLYIDESRKVLPNLKQPKLSENFYFCFYDVA